MKKRILFTALSLLLAAALLTSPLTAFADPKATVPAFVLGDTDGDLEVTSADARYALRVAVELEQPDRYSREAAASDVDYDGSVTSADARRILRVAVDLETFSEGIKESCPLFTVTVPAFWKGQYTVKTSQTSISFYHKKGQEAGMGGFLFSIKALPTEEALSGMDFGVYAFTLDGTSPTLHVVVGWPGDDQAGPANRDSYSKMSACAESIVGSMEPANWYVMPYMEDYTSLAGRYSGSDGIDMYYSMYVTHLEHNSLEARIAYDAPSGEYSTELNVIFTMIGDEGIVIWSGPDYVYQTGAVRLEDGKITVDLKSPYSDWTDTDNPIVFYPWPEE